MRWNSKLVDENNWHEIFAWKPICRINEDIKNWFWLEKIYRRRHPYTTGWQYAADEFEIIKIADQYLTGGRIGSSGNGGAVTAILSGSSTTILHSATTGIHPGYLAASGGGHLPGARKKRIVKT